MARCFLGAFISSLTENQLIAEQCLHLVGFPVPLGFGIRSRSEGPSRVPLYSLASHHYGLRWRAVN